MPPTPAGPASPAVVVPHRGRDGAPRRWLAARELAVLLAVQRRTGHPVPVALALAVGRFGDHAAGWLVLGALGWALDPPRRRAWAGAAARVVAAHAAAVVLKRVLRRSRPGGEVVVRAATPGRLSFPSSHAASSTAAAVAYGRLVGLPRAAVVVAPAMALSRLVLGVHFPSDVAAGAALGAVTGQLVGRALRRSGRPG